MIEALLSTGVFVALPLTGVALLGALRRPIPSVCKPALWLAVGLAAWSLPLMLSLTLGVYRPEILGAAGWITALLLLLRGRSAWRAGSPALSGADWLAVVGLTAAAVLAAALPADPFAAGWDMATYAAHGVYMANHGRLDVPYPWPAGTAMPAGFLPPGVLFATEPNMTVRFANLWPAWLAQTWAAFGYEGLVRVNAVLGLLALLAVYGLGSRFVKPGIVAVAVLFLAFNPAQIWVTRQTLSEILAQLLIWAGLLLLTAFLSRGYPRWGLWAGVLFGTAALARIDAFLIPALLFAGHAAWHVTYRKRAGEGSIPWRFVYAGALPVFALALLHYAVFSTPYFLELTGQLLTIAGLTIAGLAVLVVTHLQVGLSVIRRLLEHRAPALAAMAVLLTLTFYAYFLRPILPPFAVFEAPGAIYDGERMYVEDALPNLGRYLTPGVVWAGVLGWAMISWTRLRRSRSSVLWPLLVVSLGCAAVYIWNQAAWPNHFWAIRRFIPVIMPALIVFAAAAAAVALARLSRPGQRLAITFSLPLLVLYTLWTGGPSFIVPERQGSYQALSEFAATLPAEGEILAVDGSYEAWHFWMPLYLVFDRPIVALDSSTDAGRREALKRLSTATAAEPVWLVTAAHEHRMAAVEGDRSDVSWSTEVMAETVVPVPRTTQPFAPELFAIRVTGLRTLGVPFGGAPEWVARVSGFHRPQVMDGRPVRWTDGRGAVSIPIVDGPPAARLSVAIADSGRSGTHLAIIFNGTTLFEGDIPSGPWSAELSLESVPSLQP
ncbi:MAG TPA: glycosyltransferase family 39 protein, partial [Candidatus Limnocylindria bacterium]|nr:glycosyltransferase family 39 protein [Candidatus Limnocylindria bacterium]